MNQHHAVAIVGMGAVLPGAGDLETYWRNVLSGVDAITDVPAHRWDPAFFDPERSSRPDRLYCRRGGFVDEFATFAPLRFGIMPQAVADIEPDQLLALTVTAAAIEDAGGAERLPDPDRIGVILGRVGTLSSGQARYAQRVRTPEQVVLALRELLPELTEDQLSRVRDRYDDRFGPHQPEGSIGTTPNLTASRVANRFGLRGPAYTVDAACASSLLAVDQAVTALTAGRLDAVLAGGVHHSHDVSFWSVFSQLRALSRRGEIRPFDAVADGLLIGEGTGVVVLKRLADADRDGDRVYAVIRGTGVSSDGRSASMFNPASEGQALAIRRAWGMAGLDPRAPDAIGLLEAHGTATPTGDATELATIAEVFGPHHGGDRAVIGSVKSMIGHTMAAAGMAGLIKTALALHHETLPPTLHCANPRPEMAGTRFAPLDRARPWDGPRRAGVNAFGFGGINAHLVVEEHRTPAHRNRASTVVNEPERVLRLATAGLDELRAMLDGDDARLRRVDALDGPCRLGIVAPTAERLAAARRVVARGEAWRGGRDVWFAPRPLLSDGGIAFVFPGFEGDFQPRIADVAAHFGLPYADGDGVGLGRQGADLIAIGRLLDAALRRLGITPDAVAGHSTGEWTAALVAGRLTPDTVDTVVERFQGGAGEFPDHAFLAISADAARIAPMLAAHPGILLTHDNSPTQCVVNGPAARVAELAAALRAQAILCQILPFRSASHTPAFGERIRPVADELRRLDVHRGSVPLWSATLAAPFPADPREAAELMVRHMVEPVRFRETILAMHDAGIRAFLQVGPGQLAGLVQDTLRDREHLAIGVNVAGRTGLAQLRRVAVALWTDGANPDLGALEPRDPAARVVVPPASKGEAVRLDLSGSLVRLGEGAADLLRPGGSAPAHAPAPRPAPAPAPEPAPEPVPAAASVPAASEQQAASEQPAASVPAADSGLLAARAASLGVLQRSGRSGVADELAALMRESATGGAPAQRAATEPVLLRETLTVSVDAMPYLADHCFVRQPADWPDLADRRPVVPATTIVTHLMDAAEKALPGRRAIGVRDAKFARWVIAEPAQDVTITVRHAGDDAVTVAFGPYAKAIVDLADDYPAAPGPVWTADPRAEDAPTTRAREMYSERLLFHGPRFQGMRAILGLGADHVRGSLTTPAPPGGLLDSGLQIIANWLVTTQPERTLALPVRFGRLRIFGPPPGTGTVCRAFARIDRIDDAEVSVSLQISQGDRVWAEFSDTVVRRFDTHRTARLAERFPEKHGLSERQTEGWVLAYDCWKDPVSRSMAAFTILGSAGATEFDRVPTARRPQWMLGRIAVKDAVRFRQWDRGIEEVFPIELTVANDPDGRPRVTPRPGRGLIDCDVSLAHCAEAAVAIAKPRTPDDDPDAPGVGIDLTEITERPDSTIRLALTDDEQTLLDGLGDRVVWFARFWAAKEAVGKAEHTGLDGRPRAFVVQEAGEDHLIVTAGPRTYRVGFREVGNLEDLPERRYTVAWTWGPRAEAQGDTDAR